MRDFNIKLNKAILEDNQSTQQFDYSDEEMNKAVRLSDAILDIFYKNNVDMETAYMVLSALADSIYVTAVFGNELEEML